MCIRDRDGDTIDVKIEKNTFPVRLIGIDCYETGRIHRAYRQAYDNNLSIDEVIARGKQSTAYPVSYTHLDVYKRQH